MKRLLLLLCLNMIFLAAEEQLPEAQRCANCERKKQKDAALQAAALGLAATAVNSAFAIAANPDDKNSKLQAGNALALGFIGLVAAAMRTIECDIYDAQGHKLSPEQLALSIGACLKTVDFGNEVTRIMQDGLH